MSTAPSTNTATTPPPIRTPPPNRGKRSSNPPANSPKPIVLEDPNPFDLAAYNAKRASINSYLLWALRCLAIYTRDGLQLRINQERALCGILNIPQNNRTAIVVQRTGAGKTVIIQMLGAVLKGVILIVSPLLGLTSNLAPRFASDNTVCGAIDAIHLDEEADSLHKIANLISALRKKTAYTTNTSFILTSPQFLSTHTDVRDALLQCLNTRVLRAIFSDEAHLLAQQGSDFRDDIRSFARLFLRPALSHPNRPYFVGLSATMSKSSLYWLEQLIGCKIPPAGKLWDDATEFQRRNIKLSVTVTKDYKPKAAELVTKFFSGLDANDETSKTCGAVVFVNSRNICRDVTEAIEASLDKAGHDDIDVVAVHGKLEKEEKFFNLNTFCTNQTLDGYETEPVRVFVSTSACDHGIDHHDLREEVICEWPDSISVFLQRLGRLVRAGGNGNSTLLVCFANFIYLYIRSAMRQYDSFTDDESTERGWDGSNTIFSPTSKKRKVDKADMLDLSQKRLVAKTQCDDLLDMARLIVMDHGCWHLRLELYSQNGIYTHVGDNTYACQNNCINCQRSEFNRIFRRVDLSAMKSFLDSGYVRDAFPVPATQLSVKDGVASHLVDTDMLINLIWKNNSVMTNIYDVKPSSVKRYNVEMLFLSLICRGIINVVVESNGSAKFTLARVKHTSSPYPVDCYKIDEYWVGINAYKPDRKQLHPQMPIVPNEQATVAAGDESTADGETSVAVGTVADEDVAIAE